MRQMKASSASFSSTGSHVAVVYDQQIMFFATASWECIAAFNGGEDADYQYAQWAKQGTVGLITVQQESGSVLLRHGDLVKAALEATPWESLTSTIIPNFSSSDCKAFTTSPDLSKIFIAKERPVTFAAGVSRQQTICMVLDTATGAALWERPLEVTAEYHLVCNAIVWHPNSDAFTLSVHGPRKMARQGGLMAVTLSTGACDRFEADHPQPGTPDFDNTWRASHMSMCPEGVWLAMCLHFQKGPWQRAMLHWPSKQVHWIVTELSLNENAYFDLAGGRCAYISRHQPDIHRSHLCVVKQQAAAAVAPASTDSSTWASLRLTLKSHGLDRILAPVRSYHADSHLIMCMAWSPKGEYLALAGEPVQTRRNFHGRPPESAVIVFDGTSPRMPIIARLATPAGYFVRRLEWSADSAVLCAMCYHSASISNGKGSYRYSADQVESCVALYCFANS